MHVCILKPCTVQQVETPVEQILIAAHGAEITGIQSEIHPLRGTLAALFGEPESQRVCCGIPSLICGEPRIIVRVAMLQNRLHPSDGDLIVVLPAVC